MTDRSTDDTSLPEPFVRAVQALATERGIDADLAATFVRSVLRRMPTDLAAGADPRTAVSGVVDVLEQVVAGPGPSVRVVSQPASLDAGGRSIAVVQVHDLDRPFQLSTTLSTIRHLGHDVLRSLPPIIGV